MDGSTIIIKERLYSRTVLRDNGCLEWTGSKSQSGYGRMWFRKKPFPTHRLAWILSNGEIPKGLWVLHRCDNPPCMKIEHLWLGTRADNIKDMVDKGRHVSAMASAMAAKTHCPKGHEYTLENTYVYPAASLQAGARQCKACHKESWKRWYDNRRAISNRLDEVMAN